MKIIALEEGFITKSALALKAYGKKYSMVTDESNFIIIDKSGIIRYVKEGIIPKEEFPAIKEILNELNRK